MNKSLNLPEEELKRLYWNELKSLQEIGNIYNCCSVTIMRWMAKRGIPRRTRKEFFHIKPKLELTPNLAYIVGVVLGDGNISGNRVTLAVTDEIFALSFKNALEKIGLHPHSFVKKISVKNPNWKDQYVIRAKSKLFCNWVQSLTFTEIHRLPDELFINFVRGFYESEGCFTLNGYFPYFALKMTNTNKELLAIIWDRLKRMGFSFKWHVDMDKGKPSSKDAYEIRLFKKDHVKGFFEAVNPCIKNKIKCNKIRLISS